MPLLPLPEGMRWELKWAACARIPPPALLLTPGGALEEAVAALPPAPLPLPNLTPLINLLNDPETEAAAVTWEGAGGEVASGPALELCTGGFCKD